MPAKKEAAAAGGGAGGGGGAKAGPSSGGNRNKQAEKPVEEKKQQAGGHRDTGAGAGANAKGGASAQQRGPQGAQGQGAQAIPGLSNDPAEAAIQKRMNDIETKINKWKEELERISHDLDDVRKERETYFEEQKRLRGKLSEDRDSNNAVTSQRKETFARIAEFKRVRLLKIEDVKKIRERLPYPPPNDVSLASQEAYIKRLDDDIKTLEKGMAANALSLQQEKKKVDEISHLRQAKKIYKDFVIVTEKINSDSKNIADLKAGLDQTKTTVETAMEERKRALTQLDEIAEKITKSKTQGDEIAARRRPISDNIDKARIEFAKEKESLYEVRKKKKDEIRILREREIERQAAYRQERNEKKKEQEAERTKQDLLKIPYEDELYHCVSLVTYLESLLPPKPKEETAVSAPPTVEGAAILKKDEEEDSAGKKKAKKQKAVKVTQDIKHNVNVFLQFEILSITPPSKLSDVEASVAEVKAKKEHYNKLSAAAIKERQDAAAAAAAAAKTPAPASTSAESSPSQPPPTQAVVGETDPNPTSEDSDVVVVVVNHTEGEGEVAASE